MMYRTVMHNGRTFDGNDSCMAISRCWRIKMNIHVCTLTEYAALIHT